MIKGKVSIENPRALLLTMEVTMTLQQWIALRDQITCDQYPAWKFKSMIRTLVDKANTEFTETTDLEP